MLSDAGKWDDWLVADQETIEHAIRLLSMPDVLDARGEQVANLIQRHTDDSAEWRERSWMVAAVGHGYDSPEMQQLLLELIASDPNDGAVSERSKYIDQSMMLYTLSEQTPSFAPVVIGALLDREVAIAKLSAGGAVVPDQTTITIDSYSMGVMRGERAKGVCSRAVPEDGREGKAESDAVALRAQPK